VRLNLTGGEKRRHPVGRPYLPGVPFRDRRDPLYFLILVIGAASIWAMRRLHDSRLGPCLDGDPRGRDCRRLHRRQSDHHQAAGLRAGRVVLGLRGLVYAAKLQAITPGAFEFQVSIMLLCMVVLGGAGSLGGVVLGAMLITIFDRVLLSQMTTIVRLIGRSTGIAALTTIDLTLWRWFFFGLGLVLVMLLRPQGLAGRRIRPMLLAGYGRRGRGRPPPAPRVEAIPGWLRERAHRVGAAAGTGPILEVRGLVKRFGGIVALNEIDLVVPRGSIIGLIGPNGAGKTTFFNVVTGLVRPDGGVITFEGRPLAGLRPNAIVARGIARTFQSIRLFANMTVLENVLVGEHCRLRSTVPGAVFPAALGGRRGGASS
jgi:branched-chain amino acid transport system permease protein